MELNTNIQEEQLNFKLATILYSNTPLMQSKTTDTVAMVISSVISLFTTSYLLGNRSIDFPYLLSFSFVFLTCLLSCHLVYSEYQQHMVSSNKPKQVSDKNLAKMMKQIKTSGLMKQFLQCELFKIVSNPVKPILYSDIEKIYSEALNRLKLKEKLTMEQEQVKSEKLITKNQKELINQILS